MNFGDVHGIDPYLYFTLTRIGLGSLFSLSSAHMALGFALGFGTTKIVSTLFPPLTHIQAKRILWLFYFSCLSWLSLISLCSDWKNNAIRILSFFAIYYGAQNLGFRLAKWPLVFLSLAIASFAKGLAPLSSGFILCALVGIDLGKNFCRRLLVFPWLACNLLSISVFHQLFLLTPITNLVFTPLLSLFVIFPKFLGRLSEKLGLQSLNLKFGSTGDWFLKLLLIPMHSLSSLNQIAFWVPFQKQLLCFALFLVIWFSFPSFQKKPLRIMFLILVAFVISFAPDFKGEAAILDVGQGDNILLAKKDELPFLIDIGPGKKDSPYPSPGAKNLEKYGIDSLTGILITHPDWDHYGGLESILTRHRVKKIWMPKSILHFPKSFAILAAAERFQIPVELMMGDSNPFRGLECIAPANPGRETNEHCPLCRFTFASGNTLLLTGDMDAKSEKTWIQNAPKFFPATYLKVAHHGSSGSSQEDFLRAASPQAALISVGAHNHYGHPKASVLGRLEAQGVAIHRTDQEGDLWLN